MILLLILFSVTVNTQQTCNVNYTLSADSPNYNSNNNYWRFTVPISYPQTKKLCFIYKKANTQAEQLQYLRVDFLPKCLDYKNDNFNVWKEDNIQMIWKVQVTKLCPKLYRKINETDNQPFIVQLKQKFMISGFNIDANIIYKYLPVLVFNSVIIMIIASYCIIRTSKQQQKIQKQKQV